MVSLVRRAADVRIRELDLGQAAFQTSDFAGAIVVTASRGPIGPTRYRTPEAFIRDFGNPDASVSYSIYSALDYFKGGNDLWVRRAIHADAKYSGLFLYNDASGSTQAVVGAVTDPLRPDFGDYVPANGKPLYAFTLKQGPGSYADNYALKIISDGVDKVTAINVTTATTGGSFVAGTYGFRIAAVGKGGVGLASDVAAIVITSTTSTNSVTLSWSAVDGAIAYQIYGRDGTADANGHYDMGLLTTVGGGATSWTDDGLDTPDLNTGPILNVEDLSFGAQKFTIELYDLENDFWPLETHTCTVGEETDANGLQSETVHRLNSWSTYLNVVAGFSLSDSTLPSITSVAKTFFSGGTSGSAPTDADKMQAWNKFQDTEKYELDILINGGDSVPTIQSQIDYVSRKRFDCVAFLDVPSDQQSYQHALDYRNISLNLNTSFSALFTSDLYVTDPYNGKALFVPPSGTVAALLADTARRFQPWFSIAGLNRGQSGALDVRYTYTDVEATDLFNSQVNYFRKFRAEGIPLWEQNTMYSKSTGFQYINVRVLLNVLKRGMRKWLMYQLQEPNDPILQRQIQSGLDSFLSYVQGERGLIRYRITCSYANNSPATVNAGQLQVLVIIEPTLAVREIALDIGVAQAGQTFNETDVSS